jgi:pyrroline-5-carboxylate reductase
MALGFIGTGTIAAAIVRGLRRAGNSQPIVVSPRNAGLAASLAIEFEDVTVADSNQKVLDQCDTVFIAVRPQVVDAVMGELRFAPRHCVVSLVATVSLQRLEGLVAPAGRLLRAVPLPFVAMGLGGTLLYPADAELGALFDQLGRTLVMANEDDIDILTVASSTMASAFAAQAAIDAWLVDHGVAPAQSRAYLSQLATGLAASAAEHPETSYAQLTHEFATPGGLNEQLRVDLDQAGMPEAYRAGLDALLARVKGRPA